MDRSTDGLLVVGLDLETGAEVHVGDRPFDQWRSLGYRGRQALVCFFCFNGFDAPIGTRVPLLARGRLGGAVRPHFAHPAGMAPEGGHHPETIWHIGTKHRLARWARSRDEVAEVLLEKWTPDHDRRADVWVTLVDGSQLAFEAQRRVMADADWLDRHRDYASAGIRDVWFMHRTAATPFVLLAAGTQVWTVHDDGLEIALGHEHARGTAWWEGDLTLHALHHPPCPGDLIVRERFPLDSLSLDANGITFPTTLSARIADELRKTHAAAAAARTAEEKMAQLHEHARRVAAEYSRGIHLQAQHPVVLRREPTPPTITLMPRCSQCGGNLAHELAEFGRHILC